MISKIERQLTTSWLRQHLPGWLGQRLEPALQQLLIWVNLRPDEAGRTFLMFAFYTCMSVGLIWLEACAVALFLDRYGANSLAWIYIASSGIGSGLGFLYAWLQTVLPLRRVVVLIALLIAVPLLFFRVGLGVAAWIVVTVPIMRLWVEAIYVLSDLNTSITANQLFNIREIKRAYPLISSGLLVADVVSGFSLPLLLRWIDLPNVIFAAFIVMMIGVLILFYISRTHRQSFPDKVRKQPKRSDFNRRVQGPLRRYVVLILTFFVLAQVLLVLIDFQYLTQIEKRFSGAEIASFLGLFGGILGLFELMAQWFLSSRAIEWLGVFFTLMLLPAVIILTGIASFFNLFVGLLSLKFFDELLHYTLVASVAPVLFQPIPGALSARVQSAVRGIAEPLSNGFTGVTILLLLWATKMAFPDQTATFLQLLQSQLFVSGIIILAAIWLLVITLLQRNYVNLLVLSAERGQLSLPDSESGLKQYKTAFVKTLERPGPDAEKLSCIELLLQIDPKNVGEVLAPLLPNFSPTLQRKSLEAMLTHPNPVYLPQVQALISRSLPPEVLAVALRYVWLTDPTPDLNLNKLRPYLRPEVDPIVRGTAAALMLRRGNRDQKAEATYCLRQMITHKRERERVMGCRALGEADYMQALRLYIPNLLQDESLRVRRALLEAIAATRLEEYYPSLLRALHYKSTRKAAMQALVRLENTALPLLLAVAADPQRPPRMQADAWDVIGQIGTLEALDALVTHLETAWGASRRDLLRILLKLPYEAGIEAVLDRLGRTGVEQLINQEIMFVGQLYAALLDFDPTRLMGTEADLLRRSLRDMITDAEERLYLLMRFLYPADAIQAARFNLRDASHASKARGLEILDNTLDIRSKRTLLVLLDRRSDQEKLQSLAAEFPYQSLSPSDRLRYLVDLRHFLAEWPLACCFHLARQERWSLSPEAILACLHHPAGVVREAVLAYLHMASPRTLRELLPQLSHDPNPIVLGLVQQMMAELGVQPT